MNGTYRPDRHGPLPDSLPAPASGADVVKPATLSPGAAGVWDGLAPLCLALRTLTPADVAAFAVLCELQASFEAIGTPAVASDLRQQLKTAAALRPYYALFGLDPVSRSRLPPPPSTAVNPLDQFIHRARWTGPGALK